MEIASDALPQDVAPLTRKDAPQQTHLRKDPWLAVAATIHATNMFSLAMSQFSVAMSAIKQAQLYIVFYVTLLINRKRKSQKLTM